MDSRFNKHGPNQGIVTIRVQLPGQPEVVDEMIVSNQLYGEGVVTFSVKPGEEDHDVSINIPLAQVQELFVWLRAQGVVS